MATLSNTQIATLLEPYYHNPTDTLLAHLSLYLDLLLKWNSRTNLTAVRHPEDIVTRHFGESLFATPYLPAAKTLLDLGSGAGFPGLPLQLALPHLKVTLVESQNKKAAFLAEVIRHLNLETKVWSARAEALPFATRFDIITLRAVDDTENALHVANKHAAVGGLIAHWRSGTIGTAKSLLIPHTVNSFINLIPCT